MHHLNRRHGLTQWPRAAKPARYRSPSPDARPPATLFLLSTTTCMYNGYHRCGYTTTLPKRLQHLLTLPKTMAWHESHAARIYLQTRVAGPAAYLRFPCRTGLDGGASRLRCLPTTAPAYSLHCRIYAVFSRSVRFCCWRSLLLTGSYIDGTRAGGSFNSVRSYLNYGFQYQLRAAGGATTAITHTPSVPAGYHVAASLTENTWRVCV